MDNLRSRSIRIDEIPAAAAPVRPAMGRLGELWAKLVANCPQGLAEVVENRDRSHATQTVLHMRKRAKAAGYELRDARNERGDVLYLYLVRQKPEMLPV